MDDRRKNLPAWARLKELEGREGSGLPDPALISLRQNLEVEDAIVAMFGRRSDDVRPVHRRKLGQIVASRNNEVPADRRRGPRSRSLLAGKILLEDGMNYDCIIRDRSDDGVAVRMQAPAVLPDDIWLIDIKGGVGFTASVAWRSQPDLGLRLLRAFDLSAKDAPASLRRLWIERAAR